MSIYKTLYFGIEKQIENLEKQILFRDDSDIPFVLRTPLAEIIEMMINIDKTINHIEDNNLPVDVTDLKERFNKIKKTSPGRLISVLA